MPEPAAPSSSGRFAHAGVLALTVLVFAAVVGAVTLSLRAGLREQILRREAQTLAAVASMLLDNSADLSGVPPEQLPGGLYVAVLKSARLQGVSGFRLYDAQGELIDVSMLARGNENVPADVWSRLVQGDVMGRLHPLDGLKDQLDLALAAGAKSALEAWVPLRHRRTAGLVGAAQYWQDGTPLEADLRNHDERLWTQAAIAWFAGSLVIVLVLEWAFRRLAVANRELRARGEDLQRANRELVLAAKTSALGAVTAHLMHELKNPLAGLEVFIASQAGSGAHREAGSELAAASELTRRLRTMVNDVVGVLRDEQTGANFELTCAEIAEIAQAKVRADAEQRGVKLEVTAAENISLEGRRANLATLVLRNLLQNALEATPAGGVVRLTGGGAAEGGMEFRVEDSGPGLPGAVRTRLFQPCISSKLDGSGVGLALSYQLAQQAGGRLELVRSDAGGTCFRLVLAAES